MITESGNYSEEPKIIIDQTGKAYMLETARWAKFLAIIGIIVMSFAVMGLIGFLLASPMLAKELGQAPTVMSPAITIFYLVLICIFFYPLYSLLKFANVLKLSVETFNQQKFDDAFRYLKNTFKFWGIYTIILLVIYGIILLLVTTIAVTSSI